jgi:hypothetical protein
MPVNYDGHKRSAALLHPDDTVLMQGGAVVFASGRGTRPSIVTSQPY